MQNKGLSHRARTGYDIGVRHGLNLASAGHGQKPGKDAKTHHVGSSLPAVRGNLYEGRKPLPTWWVFACL